MSLFRRTYRDVDLSYFFLKERDKVLKSFGEHYAEFFLIEKSLFDFYYETKNLLWIVWYYAFIILFNSYTIPIKQNPDSYNEQYEKQHLDSFLNPFSDFVFIYANSFLYVELWLIDYIRNKILWKLEEIRKKELDKIDETHNNIVDRLNHWKNEDSNNTYCEVVDNCEKGSCGCNLHHYLTAWDNLKNDIDDYFRDLKDETNDYFDELRDYVNNAFDKLKDYTRQLFQIRLFWTFILVCVFTKLPYLAIRLKEIPKQRKEISKINKALLIIVANRHKDKDEIKERIKRKLGVSDNAVNIYLSRLKEYGYIWYDKNSRKIELRELAFKKADYLLNRYKLSLWEFR